jgi:hypothetical protein
MFLFAGKNYFGFYCFIISKTSKVAPVPLFVLHTVIPFVNMQAVY